ncbi:hypothetical protein [Micromonospora sp. NPDC047134]|uniref:hypothetical protein n=1 Tax=Micromonospora sp. NPDC047134 TaxID=3154340 RepID=UPI0033F042FA
MEDRPWSRTEDILPSTGDPNTSTGAPAVPAGGRLLSADEAVDLLVSGDHPDSRLGSVAVDATLVEALRDGRIIACLLVNGQLAFTPTPHTPAAPSTPAAPDEAPTPPRGATDK